VENRNGKVAKMILFKISIPKKKEKRKKEKRKPLSR
jgi:hypothetical protein